MPAPYFSLRPLSDLIFYSLRLKLPQVPSKEISCLKMPTRMSICVRKPGGPGSAVRHHQLSTCSTENGAAIIYANDCNLLTKNYPENLSVCARTSVSNGASLTVLQENFNMASLVCTGKVRVLDCESDPSESEQDPPQIPCCHLREELRSTREGAE